MSDVTTVSGSARRLAEELGEDGIDLACDDTLRDLLLDELDYARRIPMFEGRRPLYGSFSMPAGRSITQAAGIADLVDVSHIDLAQARTFADGRSSFVVHPGDGERVLVCFDRPVQYEAELVTLQEVTGARIVQRTAVFGQVRLFTEGTVVAWDGRAWDDRPTAAALLPALQACAPELRVDVAHGLLDLAVHWLSPARIGATLVVHEESYEWAAMDVAAQSRARAVDHQSAALPGPVRRAPSRTTWPRSSPPTAPSSTSPSACAPAGRPSGAIDSDRGMRHRSAQRFSFDHPTTTVAVVSENGPVTIFRAGIAIGLGY